LIEGAQPTKQTELDVINKAFPEWKAGTWHHGIRPFDMKRRHYKAFFVTERGYFGATFQEGHEFKPQDRVVILHRIPCPFVLGDQADEKEYSMKGAVALVNMNYIKIGKLVESGTCKRGNYKIR
jgi:hypothetical protein